MKTTQYHTGLSDTDVLKSRELHGNNILTPAEKQSLWSKFIGSFKDPIVKILLVALGLSLGVATYEVGWAGHDLTIFFEPIGILVAILLATMVGFVLELRNEKTFQCLNDVNDDILVKVIRNGDICQVARRDIVVDDIVILEIGEEVPADCILLESSSLRVNESSLTGELQASKTTIEAHFKKDGSYIPSNHIRKGTVIIEGNCMARVLKVGDSTDSGEVFEAAQVSDEKKTPLNEKLDGLAELITKVSYSFAIIIILGRLVRYALSSESANLPNLILFLAAAVICATAAVFFLGKKRIDEPESEQAAFKAASQMSDKQIIKLLGKRKASLILRLRDNSATDDEIAEILDKKKSRLLSRMRRGDADSEYKRIVDKAIVKLLQKESQKRLESSNSRIEIYQLLIFILLPIAGLFSYFLYGVAAHPNWLEIVSYSLNTIMIAVTLIVVAVPEGLPMSVTLSLAFSMKKLMDEKTLPRTMHSCETLGATSVICTDKTGTLTQNQMHVSEADFEDELSQSLIYEAIATNTTAFLDYTDPYAVKTVGNPTEGALLLLLFENGIKYLKLRESIAMQERIAFSTENKYMATVVHSPTLNQRVFYIKGAPEIVLNLCDISEEKKKGIHEKLLQYQNKAMRTLGFAYLPLDDDTIVLADGKLMLDKLIFMGITAISDPVRSEVPDAIKKCLSAGIKVKIVTGDTPGTAKEIGRQIGLWSDADTDQNHISGEEFAALSEAELLERSNDIKILSRARPNDKERLVKALKKQDMVVAVTGDGTNDAPALNAANVGLSMGDGTAVAKEASDMTILDNSFSTISNAVMWGRSLYKNIQRFILFQLTINVVACLIVLVGAFLGTQSPLTVTQMLWVNLIMDTFAALALASLPPSAQVMKEIPRKVSDFIISAAMAKNIFTLGAIFFMLMIALFVYFQHADISSLSSIDFSWGEYNGLSHYELSLFFTIFVMLQFWNIFNAKAFMTGQSAFKGICSNHLFLLMVLVIIIGQVCIVTYGGDMFNVVPLHLQDWLIIIAASSLVLWIGELLRFFKGYKS